MGLIPLPIRNRIAAAVACLQGKGVMYRMALVETEPPQIAIRPYEADWAFVELAGIFLLPNTDTQAHFEQHTS